MSAKHLEILGSKVEENWEILLVYVYSSIIYDFFFQYLCCVVSGSTHLFVGRHAVHEKKEKGRTSLELQHNCSSICTNLEKHPHFPQSLVFIGAMAHN